MAESVGGNNGTMKVDGGTLDNGPANQPHVGSDFFIEWFGFEAEGSSTVPFTMQSPTDTPKMAGAPSSVQFGPYTLDASGDFNHSFDIYDLVKNFTPQPNQGFHVKLETNTTWSNGDDSKFKTFWLSGCAPEVGSVSLAKVVSGPAPAGDPGYTFTVVADDPEATVVSPVTVKASGAAVAVATDVAVGTKVTVTETGAQGAASTVFTVDGVAGPPGASVEVTVSSATAVALVATNTFTSVLGETVSRPEPTTVLTPRADPSNAPLVQPLARTGTDRRPLVVFGLAMVGAGLALSVVSRRLRTAR